LLGGFVFVVFQQKPTGAKELGVRKGMAGEDVLERFK